MEGPADGACRSHAKIRSSWLAAKEEIAVVTVVVWGTKFKLDPIKRQPHCWRWFGGQGPFNIKCGLGEFNAGNAIRSQHHDHGIMSLGKHEPCSNLRAFCTMPEAHGCGQQLSRPSPGPSGLCSRQCPRSVHLDYPYATASEPSPDGTPVTASPWAAKVWTRTLAVILLGRVE